MQNKIFKYIRIVMGTFLMAVAYKMVFEPAGMVTGGFSGIGIIVAKLSGDRVPLWLTSLVLNIPLFVVAYKIRGKSYVRKAFAGAVLLTLFLFILPGAEVINIDIANVDFILVAVTGGVICGAGIGMVLGADAATGGTDMLASVIQTGMSGFSVVQIMQVLDGVIVLAGAWTTGIKTSIYAVIAIYIITVVSDRILKGPARGIQVFVISDKNEQVGKAIMEQIGRGVTVLSGTGLYSGKKRNVLMCIISRRELPRIKAIITTSDVSAFTFIGDVREVYGVGFVQML